MRGWDYTYDACASSNTATLSCACPSCFITFSSKKRLTKHKKVCQQKKKVETLEHKQHFKSENLPPEVERVEVMGLWSGKFREPGKVPPGVPKAFHDEAQPFVMVRFFREKPKSDYYDKWLEWETIYYLYSH